MAQQEDGWPLGLQPLSLRVGLVRNNNNGSLSFNTLLTGSPSSSTHSSSDLDTQNQMNWQEFMTRYRHCGSCYCGTDRVHVLADLARLFHIPELTSESEYGSFFHDKSIALGSLLGISSILEFSRRSTRGGRTAEPLSLRNKKSKKSKKIWLFSLCSKLSTDAVTTSMAANSLGNFLEAERRASASICREAPGDLTRANQLFIPGNGEGDVDI